MINGGCYFTGQFSQFWLSQCGYSLPWIAPFGKNVPSKSCVWNIIKPGWICSYLVHKSCWSVSCKEILHVMSCRSCDNDDFIMWTLPKSYHLICPEETGVNCVWVVGIIMMHCYILIYSSAYLFPAVEWNFEVRQWLNHEMWGDYLITGSHINLCWSSSLFWSKVIEKALVLFVSSCMIHILEVKG